MSHNLSYYQTLYTQWMRKSLALWAQRGFDQHHGWYEHLNKDGHADIKSIRRHRVQARQVFTYATADMMDWHAGENIAAKTFEFMCVQGWQGQHFVHRMDKDYRITDGRFDLYDHAFYLLAAASLYRLTRNQLYQNWIEKIIKTIDGFRHENGGWHEDSLHTLPRRQNPHMHLFEAHLYLYETEKDPRFLARAAESLNLFKSHFYDENTIAVREFFTAQWAYDPSKKDVIEPGHAAEWIWLLGWYDRLTGQDHSALRAALFDRLARRAYPYLIDETCAPHHAPVRASRRLWGQTEWIKAHITLIADGYSPAADMLPDLLGRFMKDYLTDEGLWADQFSPQGEDIAATIPVSTMYHIVGMIKELEQMGAPKP